LTICLLMGVIMWPDRDCISEQVAKLSERQRCQPAKFKKRETKLQNKAEYERTN